jgi:hypothetical protein
VAEAKEIKTLPQPKAQNKKYTPKAKSQPRQIIKTKTKKHKRSKNTNK